MRRLNRTFDSRQILIEVTPCIAAKATPVPSLAPEARELWPPEEPAALASMA
jgi:hypothetical protein